MAFCYLLGLQALKHPRMPVKTQQMTEEDGRSICSLYIVDFLGFFSPLVLIDLSFWTVILLFKNKFLYYAEKNPQRVLSWMGAFMEPELWTLF